MKKIAVFLAGPGKVGKEVLRILDAEYRDKIKVCGIMNSKKMIFDPDGIEFKEWEEKLAKSNSACSLKDFAEEVRSAQCLRRVFVDCTASRDIVYGYEWLLYLNFDFVLANKQINALPYDFEKKLRDYMAGYTRSKWLDDCTVGAGLPILSTLRGLSNLRRVRRVDAAVSGTLNDIFSGEGSWDDRAQSAIRQDLAEPNLVGDLSGTDKCLKIVAIGRAIDMPLVCSQVKCEDLSKVNNLTFNSNWKDGIYRYVGVVDADSGVAEAKLRLCLPDSIYGRLRGAEVAARVELADGSLVTVGPGIGAGATVTAKRLCVQISEVAR